MKTYYENELNKINFAEIVEYMKSDYSDIYNTFVEKLQFFDKQFTQTELIQTFHDYVQSFPNDNISVYENIDVLSDEYNPSNELKSFYEKHKTDENLNYVANQIAENFKNDTYAKNSLIEIIIDDEIRSNLQNMIDINDCMIYSTYDFAYKLNVKTNELTQFNIHTLFASLLNERDTALYVLDQHSDYDFYEPIYFIAIAMTNEKIAEFVLKLNDELN